MTKPTQYQLDQLRAMYRASHAELGALRKLAAAREAGERIPEPVDRIRKFKKAVRAIERLEQQLGVTSAELLTKEERAELHALQAPLQETKQ